MYNVFDRVHARGRESGTFIEVVSGWCASLGSSGLHGDDTCRKEGMWTSEEKAHARRERRLRDLVRKMHVRCTCYFWSVTPWIVWDCKAGWTLGKPFRYRWCPTPSKGTVEIDVPTLATEKEFAPDSVVVGNDVPCTRDALTGDHGRKIEEAEEIDGNLRRKAGQKVCRNKSVQEFQKLREERKNRTADRSISEEIVPNHNALRSTPRR